jgi:polysaccharide export outer membrane protein
MTNRTLLNLASFASIAVLGTALVFVTGCASNGDADLAKATAQAQAQTGNDTPPQPEKLILREGDTVRVSFPGAPNLNAVQSIRRDGKISLQLVGEVAAAGMTPSDLEKKLLELYGPQLQTKEVTVALESIAFPVYVSGAVLRPGKIISDRPLTALEAIMEAGGFNYSRANLKNVRVIRQENGRTVHFNMNLKPLMSGKPGESFTLKPSDIIYVPERFSWF